MDLCESTSHAKITGDVGETLVLYWRPKGKTASGWKMTQRYLEQYAADPQIQTFEFQTKTTQWWGKHTACVETTGDEG